MWFYWRWKDHFLIPKNLWPGLLPVDRDRSRSTGPVDRCAQTCIATLAGGPIDRPGQPLESSALWIWPRSTGRSTGRELLLSVSRPRSTVDRQRASALCIQASVDRRIDRWHNDLKSDRRPVDRQQDLLLSWPPTVIFWKPINWGSLRLFWIRFEVDF